MKKISFLTMLFLAPFTLCAAEQLTKQQAEEIKPFKEISIRGLYYSILEYQRAISSAADKAGADSYYITDVKLFSANERMRIITANLYKNNAEKVTPAKTVNEKKDNVESYNLYDGVYEYDKVYAQTHEYSKVIYVKGYFPTPLALRNEIIKKSKKENAAGFYIYRVSEIGSNEEARVLLFNKNAPITSIQVKQDEIPLDSVQSTKARNDIINQNKAQEVSVSSVQKNNKVERDLNLVDKNNTNSTDFVKTKDSERYTVTLPNGEAIQELNDATAAKMTSFKTVKFSGYFGTPTEISRIAAKKAAENKAKFYHIARISQMAGGGRNRTVYIELFD